MKNIVKIIAVSASVMPFMAVAQRVNTTYLSSLISGAKSLLDQLVVFLVALAVVWFIWNVIRYTISADEEKKGEAKNQMIYGIIAIAVIVSIWGLVAILQSIFGVNSGAAGDVTKLLP